MSTIRNEIIIAHHYNKKELEEFRNLAVDDFTTFCTLNDSDNKYDVPTEMISPIMRSFVNGEYAFFIMGDCSKNGYETQQAFHEFRLKWVQEHAYKVMHLLIVNFGEGDARPYIFDESDYL